MCDIGQCVCLRENLFFLFFGPLLISLMLAQGYYSSRVGALSCSARCTRVLFCDWLLYCHVNTHLFKGPFCYVRRSRLVMFSVFVCCMNKLGNVYQSQDCSSAVSQPCAIHKWIMIRIKFSNATLLQTGDQMCGIAHPEQAGK